MSQANAAARKRRAGGSSMPGSNDNNIQQQQQQQPPASGLTLPQVIALVDRRLVVLETFMKETKTQAPAAAAASPAPTMDDEFVEYINSKFEMLANEIADLKDMLLKLQTFTMEVNKRLVDERIQLLSDVKVGDNVVFDLSDDNE
jgi:hypothetical protein